jgi:putative ABC transport system permease protein
MEMEVISRRLERLDPEENKGWSIQVEGLRERADGGNLETLYLLMGAVAFILLIACSNVANLLLARATSREKEISIRAALGADRLSLLRQLLTESLVLAVLGGALGVLLSLIGVRIFAVMAPTWLFDVGEFNIDLRVLGFTLGISLLAGLLFGVLPALRVSKADLHESLKEGGRSSRSFGGRSRNALVVAEVALALVLLVGAGLMANSFVRIQQVDPGFDPKNLLVVEVFLAGTQYWDYAEGDLKRVTSQGLPFFEQVLERIRALPGVVSASTAGPAPPGNGWRHNVEIVGQEPQAEGNKFRADYCEVSPGFFETLAIPLLKGRYLNAQDVESSTWVVVINETMAKQFFPNDDPVGKSLRLSMPAWSMQGDVDGGRPREIVGVVGDVKRWSVRRGQRPLMYSSHNQHVWEYPGGQYSSHLRKDFGIRTATNPMSLARDVRRIVAEVDPSQTVYDTRTMEQALAEMLAPERFLMQLYGIFAAFAVILAAVGIYGVMSYSVSQRTHEFGVRMAVGAQKADVLTLVIKHGLKLTVIGLAIGLGASYWLTSLVSGYLYGVTPADPFTLAAVSIVLLAVTLAACYIPARWATKVDPLVALRHE